MMPCDRKISFWTFIRYRNAYLFRKYLMQNAGNGSRVQNFLLGRGITLLLPQSCMFGDAIKGPPHPSPIVKSCQRYCCKIPYGFPCNAFFSPSLGIASRSASSSASGRGRCEVRRIRKVNFFTFQEWQNINMASFTNISATPDCKDGNGLKREKKKAVCLQF